MSAPVRDDGPRSAGPFLALAALYVLAVAVYAVLGGRSPIPTISPDEFTYGHLARSVADGEGLSWRGEDVALRGALYIYAIAPAWAIASSTTGAYALAKVLGAALCATVVVPTWLLARRAVGPWVALAPAALSLAGTWMLVTTGILTENLAYPLGAAALAATVVAVQQPASRWPWAALGLVVAAALSRSQLAVLVAVLPLAALVDAARGGRAGFREGLTRHRRMLIAGSVLTVAGAIAALASPSTVLGSYEGLSDYGPGLGAILTSAGRHAVGLVAMAGLLPAVLVLALTALRSAWADEHLGPMLAVFWPATVVLVAEVAWYMAGGGREWHIERYLVYVMPLAMTIAVAGVVRTRPGWQPVVIVTLALSVLLLLAAPMRNVTEEEGVFGVLRPLHGLLGTSTAASLAIATLVVGLGAAALLARGHGQAASSAAALLALTLGVLVVQDAAAWSWRIDAVRAVRSDRPADLRWLDRAAHGPVARLVVAANSSTAQLTEFFNRDADRYYVPVEELGTVSGPLIHGKTCTWNAVADGRLVFEPGCGRVPPQRFLLDDEAAKVTLAGQRLVHNEPKGGRVVEVAGAPRLLSLVFVPCGPVQHRIVIGDDGIPRRAGTSAVCEPGIRGNLWLDRPGRLELRFRGGVSDQRIAAGGRVTTIPAGGTATVRVPAPGRPTGFQFQLDWTGTGPQYPTLEAFDLVQGGTRTDLIGVAR